MVLVGAGVPLGLRRLVCSGRGDSAAVALDATMRCRLEANVDMLARASARP